MTCKMIDIRELSDEEIGCVNGFINKLLADREQDNIQPRTRKRNNKRLWQTEWLTDFMRINSQNKSF